MYTKHKNNIEAEDSLIKQNITLDSAEISSEESGDSDDSDGVGSTLSQTQQKAEYSVILLGDSQTGKSALVSRFMDTEVFVKVYHETMVDTYH